MPPVLRRRDALVLPAAALATPARAQAEPLDLLLVLAIDASGSIDPDEFRLQRMGCAEAVSHPAVVQAVMAGKRRAIGAAVVDWGSPGGAATVVDWHRVTDAASAAVLADSIRAAPRSPQSWNAIGDAIDHAAALIAAAPWAADERVIDISGDGPDLRGNRSSLVAREDAAARGITVNALAIEERPGLAATYEATVIAGPGAFVMRAESRQDFARALRAKLVREIA